MLCFASIASTSWSLQVFSSKNVLIASNSSGGRRSVKYSGAYLKISNSRTVAQSRSAMLRAASSLFVRHKDKEVKNKGQAISKIFKLICPRYPRGRCLLMSSILSPCSHKFHLSLNKTRIWTYQAWQLKSPVTIAILPNLNQTPPTHSPSPGVTPSPQRRKKLLRVSKRKR